MTMTREEIDRWRTARWIDAHESANDTINELAAIASNALESVGALKDELHNERGLRIFVEQELRKRKRSELWPDWLGTGPVSLSGTVHGRASEELRKRVLDQAEADAAAATACEHGIPWTTYRTDCAKAHGFDPKCPHCFSGTSWAVDSAPQRPHESLVWAMFYSALVSSWDGFTRGPIAMSELRDRADRHLDTWRERWPEPVSDEDEEGEACECSKREPKGEWVGDREWEEDCGCDCGIVRIPESPERPHESLVWAIMFASPDCRNVDEADDALEMWRARWPEHEEDRP